MVVVLVAAAIWAFSPRYEVLFGELDENDAANIVSELDKSKVSYQLDKNGTQILVPHEDVLRTRLNLMNSGLSLKGVVGFEIFDNADYGMTEFAQKINYQRALQGELARTIMALREVKFARVHLVLAESGLLRSEKRSPSASVALMMREGLQIMPAQITGIQRLVAAAVPALAPENVTVTDHSGISLTPEVDVAGGEMMATSKRLQKKIEVEKYLKEKIDAVLDRAVGSKNYVASVDVTLNLTQKKTVREDVIVSEDGSDPVSRRREAKTSTGAKTDTKGDSTTTEIEYLHGKQMDEILVVPGQIERISVGIFVKEKLSLDRMMQLREL
ncbi:MAG: flagellar basal-body MS-ring/collar protein FliF, partial [Gammaproteobacteria bacterium]|nr:flagellar basal-body MS-ring/collar protein FliF [Gammaproteobacteria bacterium]